MKHTSTCPMTTLQDSHYVVVNVVLLYNISDLLYTEIIPGDKGTEITCDPGIELGDDGGIAPMCIIKSSYKTIYVYVNDEQFGLISNKTHTTTKSNAPQLQLKCIKLAVLESEGLVGNWCILVPGRSGST